MPTNRRKTPRKQRRPRQRHGVPPAPDRASKPRGKPFEEGNASGYEKRFPKGVSGNPGGVPKDVREFREACQQRLGKALTRMDDVLDHGSEEGILKAFRELSANGYGRPPQPVELGGPGGGPVRVTYDDVRLKLNDLTAKALAKREAERADEEGNDDDDAAADPADQE